MEKHLTFIASSELVDNGTGFWGGGGEGACLRCAREWGGGGVEIECKCNINGIRNGTLF